MGDSLKKEKKDKPKRKLINIGKLLKYVTIQEREMKESFQKE